MAIVFVAIVVVLLLTHFVSDVQRLRSFAWLRGWQTHGAAQASPGVGLIMIIGVPVVLCLLVQLALHDVAFGLPSLAFAILVLLYCLGPRDLERDVEAVDKAPDSDRRVAAAQALNLEESNSALPFVAEPLVEATFTAGLRRLFGVLFWFALLGPVGALCYRVCERLAHAPAHTQALPQAQHALVDRLARLLDWLPAHAIALSLAIASDFDAVLNTWREYHVAHGKGYWCLDSGFLGAIARASVDADVDAGEGHVIDKVDPLIELDDAMTLIRRVLVVWLALLALIVIAGVFG